MIYTDKFAFIHVPKTSGMSIKKSIKNNCPSAIYMPENTFKNDTSLPDWRRVMHYPYGYWQHLIEDKWVFSVVRNPFIRAASMFVYIKTIYAFKDKYANLTFKELFTKNNTIEFYIPTTTQTEFLTGKDNTIVPNIYKYEDGYLEIEKVLGFKISEKINISPSYNYLDLYDEKMEKLILDVFEKDFENFSYPLSLK